MLALVYPVFAKFLYPLMGKDHVLWRTILSRQISSAVSGLSVTALKPRLVSSMSLHLAHRSKGLNRLLGYFEVIENGFQAEKRYPDNTEIDNR